MRIDIKGTMKTLAVVVGAAESGVGVLAIIVAYILHINFFGLRAWLNVITKFVPLYTLILIVFGLFSIISGLFLISEREETP